MCVIIVKQKGRQLPDGVAKASARLNPDGLGVVWLDTYEVSYHKSKEWGVLETNRPFIAHFRYATVGKVGRSNTHPFVCGPKSNELLMMNGTIRGLGNAEHCDSKVLAQDIGKIPRVLWKKELSKYNCRFVTTNVNKKTYEIYNKHLWTIQDGVWYSKDNVLETNMIAVYGTLKKGYSNSFNYLQDDSKYIGNGETKDRYPLIVKGLPYLIDKRGMGHNVNVDVFAVSDSKLAELDRLEGHPHWYQRRRVDVRVNGKLVSCWVYFNIKEKVTDDSILQKSYFQSTTPLPSRYEFEFDRWDNFAPKQEVSYLAVCIECYHDLQYDLFGNYHCSGCDGWFKESEILKL